METNDFNPWNVENLEEFLYYWCPECDDKHQSRELFLKHALEEHQKSQVCLLKFQVKQELSEEMVYSSGDPSMITDCNSIDHNDHYDDNDHYDHKYPNSYVKYEPEIDLNKLKDVENNEEKQKKQSDNFICKICDLVEKMIDNGTLKAFLNGKYFCAKCEISFTECGQYALRKFRRHIEKHLKKEVKKKVKKELKCNRCNKKFPFKSYMDRHEPFCIRKFNKSGMITNISKFEDFQEMIKNEVPEDVDPLKIKSGVV